MDQAKIRKIVSFGVLGLLVILWWTSGTSERQLLKQLRTGNPEERYAAIRGLAEKDSRKANAAITEHIQDAEPRVAGRAVLALGTMRRDANVELLEKGLADARPEIREASAIALGRLDVKMAVRTEGLIRILDTDESASARMAAATALGQRKVRDGMPALIAALEDDDPEVRSRAAGAIREISGKPFGFPSRGDPEARAAIIKQIKAWWQQSGGTDGKQITERRP